MTYVVDGDVAAKLLCVDYEVVFADWMRAVVTRVAAKMVENHYNIKTNKPHIIIKLYTRNMA